MEIIPEVSSASSPALQVDFFVKTLRELQEEQAVNQQCVAAAQAKRIATEKKLDSVLAKHAAVADKNNKMLAIQKAAEFKTAKAEEEATRLEKSNAEKKMRIKELSDAIAIEENEMTENLHSFEDALQQLADSLRNAIHFYSKENLRNEISKVKDSAEEACLRVSCGQSAFISLSRQMEELKVCNPGIEELSPEDSYNHLMSAKDWENAVDMFHVDSKIWKQSSEELEQKLQLETERKDGLIRKVADLEQELERKEKEKAALKSKQAVIMQRPTAAATATGQRDLGSVDIGRRKPSGLSPTTSSGGSVPRLSAVPTRLRPYPVLAGSTMRATGPGTAGGVAVSNRTKYGLATPRLIAFPFSRKSQ